MKQHTLEIQSNRKISKGHYVLEVSSSDGMFSKARPGQFVQMMVDPGQEPFLPRPFSFLDVGKRSFRILYQVVGVGTEALSKKKKGDKVIVIGPLGNGFTFDSHREAFLVGGGVGIPPLYHLAKTVSGKRSAGNGRGEKTTVFLGGRNENLLHCEKGFKALDLEVRVSTDDGSKGHKGFVTEILEDYIREDRSRKKAVIYACGPTPMLESTARVAKRNKVTCQVSVEECMPCGFGACLGCAIKVRGQAGRRAGGQAYRYAMSCTEGPVFDAKEILWN